MGNWQIGYLIKERAYSSDSGTIYVDLPSNEKLSMIMVELSLTSAAALTVLGSRSILDAVTDVQVLLEGAKTAYKATPALGSFLSFLAAGKVPPHRLCNRGTQMLRLPIYFGRKPFDEEYMLDTGLYANAQLQIAYALNTTYELTGGVVVTVWFVRPLEALTPVGFIRSRIVNSTVTAATAGEVTIDLPTSLPWLRVGARIYDYDQSIENDITDLDLDIDEGRLHIFQGRIEDLITLQKLWYGEGIPMNRNRAMAITDDWLPSHCGSVSIIMFMDESADQLALSIPAIYGPSFQIKWDAAVAHETLATKAFGELPFSGLVLGKFDDEPYNAPAHADAKIVYTQGAYAMLLETFVQEIVVGAL